MANSQEKITVYNLADLKNTSDDAIPNYLNSLKFTPSHRLTDVRLALGYSAFALAAACFLWDYKFGFESTKTYTAAAVAVYTALNTFLTFWILYIEKGTIYQGTSPDGQSKIRISSSVKKHVPIYHLTVEAETATKDGMRKEKVVLKQPFTDWFDASGRFVAAPFQTMLATGIPVVGRFDAKRVAASSEGTTAYTPEMLDALASAEVATGTESKKTKRRKA
ncbi:microsomal signal peptidase 25 kDa subunit-domain-containing protein [Echria macrotheca]|uniref:Signal peptidase complex subunit 2 n=1 Tax=Echria macrotheca TaxID=438768 RepID=A0AAJ0BJ96_9PEZI|nr:microsomal signal peptidase 25 kDa subunit-domain-containing protein [Echria macrotheca]